MENDDAREWPAQLDGALPQTLRLTFEPVTMIEQDLFLDASYTSEAVAGAEVVAAMCGNPGPSAANPKVMAWVRNHQNWVDGSLVRMAAAAVRRVRDASELRELWSQTGELDVWIATLDDLLIRLV